MPDSVLETDKNRKETIFLYSQILVFIWKRKIM